MRALRLSFCCERSQASRAIANDANAQLHRLPRLRWSARAESATLHGAARGRCGAGGLMAAGYAYLATIGTLRGAVQLSGLSLASFGDRARGLASFAAERQPAAHAWSRLTYVLLTVALLLRMLALLIVGVQSGTSIRLDVALVLVTGMLTALWGICRLPRRGDGTRAAPRRRAPRRAGGRHRARRAGRAPRRAS